MSEQQFQAIRRMAPNWDSYGADAPKLATVDRAYELWKQLPNRDEWQVVPCSDGCMQIELHKDGFDVEISVRPSDEVDEAT